MTQNKLDPRKARRLKRRAANRERGMTNANYYQMNDKDIDEEGLFVSDLLSFVEEQKHVPLMELCSVSRDKGETWTDELINVKITDPELSVLRVGDFVKKKNEDATYMVVANEGETQFPSFFQNDPDSPLYLPEGHLYWNALPDE
ncbi:hypothetical protein ACFQZE_19235 [Paenibacillus sp. GCM10027627]|uniref:hypothetical protein n=1 Tax=unclassified Paenibacillus TaxID=185978 RepID=UPI003624D72B